MRENRKGFSLIELIISICIIALLLIISIPKELKNEEVKEIEKVEDIDIHLDKKEHINDAQDVIDKFNESTGERNEKIKEIESKGGKIENREELMNEFIYELSERKREIKIDYYGSDIVRKADLIDFLEDLKNSGGYYASNIDAFKRYDADPIKAFNGSYSVEIFDIEYKTTDKQEEFINGKIRDIVDSIITNDMNDYDKIKTIHDYVVDNKTYNIAANIKDGKDVKFSAYGFLKYKTGVCSSFALTTSKLLNEVGIENYYTSGIANNGSGAENHAWNKVKLDGDWYNLDTTWDQPIVKKGYTPYEYFLKSDKNIEKTHKSIKAKNEPVANSTRYE